MKIRNNGIKVYYANGIHCKWPKYYSNENIVNHGDFIKTVSGNGKYLNYKNQMNHKLKGSPNYYTRNEKKHILKNIYENIRLQKNELSDEMLKCYLEDEAIKKILENEKIYDDNSKIAKIKEIEKKEEELIKKFNNFYDLLYFSIENLKRQNKIPIKMNIESNIEKDFLGPNLNNNVFYKNHELIVNNLEIIKKFLIFMDKNLSIYNITSSSFKLYFCLNKFVIYFFNYFFQYVNYFDLNLLLKYCYLYIKLNLFEDNLILYNQKKRNSEKLYHANISDEDIFEITKNNNNVALKLLGIITDKKGHHELPDLCELYILYFRKTNINKFIQIVCETNFGNKEDDNIRTLRNEDGDKRGKIGNEFTNALPIHTYRMNHDTLMHKHNDYFICLYFNFLFLLNKIIGNYALFLPKINKQAYHLLDCIGLLCEQIFEGKNGGEKKIRYLLSLLNSISIEKYIIMSKNSNNYYMHEKNKKKNMKNVIFLNNEYDDEGVIKNSNENNAINAIDSCKDKTNSNSKELCGNENKIIKNQCSYEDLLLNVYKNTHNNVISLFESMSHYFILEDCDLILKFLQIIYVTRYMNIYNINILFYSIWLNSTFFKMYQVKNVLFFLSLFKSSFVMKGMDLQKSIYNWYNKQLIFYLRKRIEGYFENNTLEDSIKSIFVLSDLISYNKVVKKILIRKLVILNFNKITPTIFCQIFFLLSKLRFNASNKLFFEIFLKHYKKVINSLTYMETLDLIKNIEYLIPKKKRKIFIIIILYFFRKLEHNNLISYTNDTTPISLNHVFKLINIINKFKLYEYCNKIYFNPLYQLIFTTINMNYMDHNQNNIFFVSKDILNVLHKNSNYSFMIKNNKTVLIDKSYKMYEQIKNKGHTKSFASNEIERIGSSNNNKDVGLTYQNGIIKEFSVNLDYVKNMGIKLELLRTSQILDLIFFNINTKKNVILISEIYTDLFYRIIRNCYFSKKELSLSFRSIWMSRIFHLNFLAALIDTIKNNIKIVDTSIFSLDILLCLCTYKHEKLDESLVITLFNIFFEDIDRILKNVKNQILFYYCLIFLELYYPFLFLKAIKKRTNAGKYKDTSIQLENENENHSYNNVMKKYDLGNENGNASHCVKGIKNNYKENMKNNLKEKNEISSKIFNTPHVLEKISGTHIVDILKYIKHIFFLQQKKCAHSYELIKFYEVLDKLNITKMKFNNVPNVFFKNYEINDLFVLHIYFPQLKFAILFTKKGIAENSGNNKQKCVSSIVENDNMNTFKLNGDKRVKEIKSGDFNYTVDMGNYSNNRNNVGGSLAVKSNSNDDDKVNNPNPFYIKNNYIDMNSPFFEDSYEKSMDIMAQKLYLYKNYKINIMVIPMENIIFFFKMLDKEKQNCIINESNYVFDNVYNQILSTKKINNNLEGMHIVASLLKKQLQYIFSL
ncbi:conserved Plasmodium protein, unknown function [Plasmodium berghei]|uniref:Uncharacterized protein n=2 Tax=Plasmodium berghei TaxID=5821 RepID=A0A509ARP6_PLABA|nr:conserved Plasmodium protein, unknown function [Plasmodium berghei ANKA]CXI87456.1 conserved Plasmodium protein, unknown function [Plasmodium berghei]SCL95793.1 conserved Plasmodium protein, unknown function [Plasmodium berghei]SCM16286.1 conserved Plasmodium protein, unknown function [Plasmodium berghei]SCM18082.1 conserved Plasmodium protein, unknown function [Plasmodium berghei]SCN27508.1 conserved Plasmodium protein, unknown function [Plasmodium berghei]|eukprot:XP_034423164.1 conserved Plasmodium protein, unknown function [Plasmodium berghei ANKA]